MAPFALTEKLAAVLRTVAIADLCEESAIAKVHGQNVRAKLDQLYAAGLVLRQTARQRGQTRTALYSASMTGRDRLYAFDAAFRKSTDTTSRTTRLVTAGIYTGAELRPYVARQGALDAYALPSRMGRRLHHPSGEVVLAPIGMGGGRGA